MVGGVTFPTSGLQANTSKCIRSLMGWQLSATLVVKSPLFHAVILWGFCFVFFSLFFLFLPFFFCNVYLIVVLKSPFSFMLCYCGGG